MKKIMEIKSKKVSAQNLHSCFNDLSTWWRGMKLTQSHDTLRHNWQLYCDKDMILNKATFFGNASTSSQSEIDWLLSDGNDRLLFRIDRNDEHIDFSSCFCSSRFDYERCVFAAQTEPICHRYDIYIRLNWSSIDIGQNYYNDNAKNVIDYYLKFNRGTDIVRHRQTFFKNEKLLVTQEILFGRP